MSKIDNLKNKIKEDEKRSETAAAKEQDKEPEKEKNFSQDPISNAFSSVKPVKPVKTLKGIYLDADVLKVYEEQAKLRGRGWGSQLVSDLLRNTFEQYGLMDKK